MKIKLKKNSLYITQKIIRRLILISIDSFIILISCKVLQQFFLDSFYTPSQQNIFFIINLLVGIIVYTQFGQYQSLSTYIHNKIIYQIALRNCLIIFLTWFVTFVIRYPYPNFSYNLFFFWLISSLNIIYRFILKDFLISLKQSNNRKKIKVAIYGAGIAGAQLAESINLKKNFQIITFIDDSPALWGRNLAGIQINSLKYLEKHKNNIDQILIAIPSISSSEKARIIRTIHKYNIKNIFEVPSLDDLITGKTIFDNIEKIEVDTLLRRNTVSPNKKILKNLKYSIVCVTGAGGSIGSELCRQIINLDVKALIMLDISESNLYLIDKEIRNELNYNPKSCSFYSVLGSCCDKSLLDELISKHSIEIIFHAAAYKHVPLVEENPLEGLYNNVFSTMALCEASLNAPIKKLILVSTDKAVRPTNLMGASKRLAELIVQAFAENEKLKENKTKFAMVRFGNVLNSSGSVVPLFKEQIRNGGPLTVTHPEMTRYFMTIIEAAQLVIQSAEMTKGGEVFLLDMGKPISILNLAKQMIKLSGLKLKDDLNQDGDIEIKFTGLRSGEKLYEELLIDSKCMPTKHPLIYKANENKKKPDLLFAEISNLKKLIRSRNTENVVNYLSKLIPEWKKSKLFE